MEWLLKRAGARTVVTGPNFSFGRSRSGDAGALAVLGARHGLRAVTALPVVDGDEPVSSSRVRALLRAGRCRAANALLTRPFTVSGVTGEDDYPSHNAGRTRAKLSFGDYVRVADGTYVSLARLADGKQASGVALIDCQQVDTGVDPGIRIELSGIHDCTAGQPLDLQFLDSLCTASDQHPQGLVKPLR